MKLSRRMFIMSGTALPLVFRVGFASAFDNTSRTLFVVLEGLDRMVSARLAEQILDTFFSAGIPVTALLRCTSTEAENTETGIMRLFRNIAKRERGLFELALGMEQDAERERYFQLRNAIDLRDCMMETDEDNAGELSANPVVSILNFTKTESLEPYALRAAGFRVQLLPEMDDDGTIIDAKTKFEVVDWGIAHLEGGSAALVESPPEPVLSRLAARSEEQILYLSFQNATDQPPDVLLEQSSNWAAQLQSAMLEGITFLTRPIDHLLQGNPGASKYIGLVLDYTSPSGSADNLTEFAERLAEAEFPYTAIGPEAAVLPDGLTDICTLAESGDSMGALCMLSDQAPPGAQTRIVLHRTRNPDFWSGPRNDGRFHAAVQNPENYRFDRLTEDTPLTDMILEVSDAQIATPVQQEALIRQLSGARSDGKVHFYSVGGYMKQIVAPDPVLQRFWSTRRRQVSDPIAPKVLDDLERERLLEDARLAWRFIERHSDEETGICAGTVQASDPLIVNQGVTLWDVASQLNGIQAANELSLISGDEALERIGRILDNLPTLEIDGFALPPSLFDANNPQNARSEFDSCDTGRFLISLDRLVNANFATRERAEELLSGWDIAQTVENRRALNYSNRKWTDVTESHCSQYARNGYTAWGILMDSAYPALPGNDTGDQYIRLLYKAAFIGHFGTEPLLLEALEVGFSPETRYLSDVLFDAQLSWYEETGQFKCVSEASLNFEPWFSYQGLRVDLPGADAWVISSIGGSTANQSAQFASRADIISSKAAYLWAATYPHEYSSRLLALIREKARIKDLGFSIGVFGATLEPMKNYSDVNTNGVILTAIADILRPPRP